MGWGFGAPPVVALFRTWCFLLVFAGLVTEMRRTCAFTVFSDAVWAMDALRLVIPDTSVSMCAIVAVVWLGVMVALQLGARDGLGTPRLQEHSAITHTLDVPRHSPAVLRHLLVCTGVGLLLFCSHTTCSFLLAALAASLAAPRSGPRLHLPTLSSGSAPHYVPCTSDLWLHSVLWFSPFAWSPSLFPFYRCFPVPGHARARQHRSQRHRLRFANFMLVRPSPRYRCPVPDYLERRRARRARRHFLAFVGALMGGSPAPAGSSSYMLLSPFEGFESLPASATPTDTTWACKPLSPPWLGRPTAPFQKTEQTEKAKRGSVD